MGCDSSNVILLAGAADDRVSPEVSIDGKARGALSYAFARSLEGHADADKDGVITRKELVQFVRATVPQRSDSQQVIVSKPDQADDVAFMRLK